MDQTWAEPALSIAGQLPSELPVAEAVSADFERLYTAYAPLLRKIAVRKFNVPRSDADALVHDVFATYLVNQEAVRELHPYLIGAICNAARKYLRKEDRERALTCDQEPCAATPDDALLDEVLRNITIRNTLAKLGEPCRDALRRFYMQGETTAAIAAARNTSAGYIRRLLTFCRTRAHLIHHAMERGR